MGAAMSDTAEADENTSEDLVSTPKREDPSDGVINELNAPAKAPGIRSAPGTDAPASEKITTPPSPVNTGVNSLTLDDLGSHVATTKMIRRELQQVLCSKTFAKSYRLRRFLEYVVQKALAGEHKAIKEYTLGLEVFDRLPSFDPSSDPIVRVEASRLRNRLSVYYSTEGSRGPLRIDLPKGRYSPVISPTKASREKESGGSELACNKIMIQPFSHIGGEFTHWDSQVDAVAQQLMHLLTRCPQARVLSRISSSRSNHGMDPRELGEAYGVHYIVDGNAILLRNTCHVLVYLVESARGYNIWSGCYEVSLDGAIDAAQSMTADLLAVLQERSVVAPSP
jgi:TolB-like protein